MMLRVVRVPLRESKVTLVETRLAKRCAAGQGSRVGIEQRAFAQLKIDF